MKQLGHVKVVRLSGASACLLGFFFMNVFLFKNTDNGPSILDECPFFMMAVFFIVNGFFSGSCLALSI